MKIAFHQARRGPQGAAGAEERLAGAAMARDMAALAMSLDSGARPDAPSLAPEMNPLELCAKAGFSKGAKALLKAGASPNGSSERRGAPLAAAIKRGALDIALALIRAKADLKCHGSGQERGSPLLLAIRAAGSEGGRPAQKRREMEALALALIKAGAPLGERGADGLTPLAIACSQGMERLARALLEAGAPADEGFDLGSGSYGAGWASPESPLSLLCRQSASRRDADEKKNGDARVRIMTLLLEHGANPEGGEGQTPLSLVKFLQGAPELALLERAAMDRAGKGGPREGEERPAKRALAL